MTLLELLEAYVASIWATSATLGQAIVRLQTDDILHPSSSGYIGTAAGQLRENAKRLNLRATHRACEHFGAYVSGHAGPITHQRLREMILHLLEVMGGELEDRTFLALPPEVADLYRDPSAPFDKTVLDAFPRATEDLCEAGKCLALDRSTAAVFHLMRAMECAVQALSAKLEIKNTERAWGSLLSDIHTKIEAMPKGDKRNMWSEAHAHLYHVKQAWRNDTMHPKQTYTFLEAKAIFDAVKVFMNHLAPFVRP